MMAPISHTANAGAAMGRTRMLDMMSPEQRSKVDSLLRRYKYGCIDRVIGVLSAEGIKISRSTLHRHAQQLRNDEQLIKAGAETTAVIVIDLRSAASLLIRTSAVPSTIVSAIRELNVPSVGRG